MKRSALSYAFAGVHGISLFDGLLEGELIRSGMGWRLGWADCCSLSTPACSNDSWLNSGL